MDFSLSFYFLIGYNIFEGYWCCILILNPAISLNCFCLNLFYNLFSEDFQVSYFQLHYSLNLNFSFLILMLINGFYLIALANATRKIVV